MSVRGNTKSKGHRKAYLVEPCGTGRKFMHLTRGGLLVERPAGVSRGHSSEEACGNTGRAKGQRTKREQSTDRLAVSRRVPKANGGTRHLGVPSVQDRVIQQTIHQKLSAYCECFFSEHSYGFRPNRSAHDAVRAAQEYVRQGKRYVVDIDLKSFFEEVNHDKLLHLLLFA